MGQGVLEGGGGRVVCRSRVDRVRQQAAGLVVEHLVDVVVEPHAGELGGAHVAGAVDGAAAGGLAAEAFEWLGHVPFCGWVEELRFLV